MKRTHAGQPLNKAPMQRRALRIASDSEQDNDATGANPYSRKAAAVQTFGFLLTELVMLLSIVNYLDSLRYTKVYLATIPLLFSSVLAVIATTLSNDTIQLTMGVVMLSGVGEFAYFVWLCVSHSVHALEIKEQGHELMFYGLLLGVLVAIVQLVWISVLLLQLQDSTLKQRMASAELTGRDASIVNRLSTTALLYASVVSLSSLSGSNSALAWSSFYEMLLLPYGTSFMMVMLIFKNSDTMRWGMFLLISVGAFDVVYTVFTSLSYVNRREELAYSSAQETEFLLLLLSVVLRAVLVFVAVGLANKLKEVPLEDRLNKQD
jgi:hypothetical protein